jgi:hypothetical protein
MDSAEKIERFLNHFSEHFEKIRALAQNQFPTVYCKILYVAFIDALAKSVFSDRGNRGRFVAFLKQFSGWEYGERISLPHLVRLTEKDTNPLFNNVRQFAQSQLCNWFTKDIITLGKDLSIEQLRERMPAGRSFKIGSKRITLDQIQHWYLLYNYRNKLVHELLEPGTSFDAMCEGDPAYLHIIPGGETMYDGRFHGWQLIYPTKFFQQLCVNSLNNLGDYFRKNDFDPVKNYSEGRFFVDVLNE